MLNVATIALLSLAVSNNDTSDRLPSIATGIVFEDLNRDGTRQAGEPGLEGVLVTNGLEVVLSGSDGRYKVSLPDPADTIISVIDPAGFTSPVDALGIPRFYYTHKPEGSRDDGFVYVGSDPTGPLPASVDFPLTARSESARFNVLLVGDPQPYTEQEISWYGRDVISELRTVPAAFAIALGDLVGDDLDLFTPYNQMNALSGHTWRNVFGNHDQNYMSSDDKHSDETYERVFGPTDYAFFRGQTLFIMLDNVRWNGFDGLRKDGLPKSSNYVGAVSNEQVEFVTNILKHTQQDTLVVLSTHIPLVGANDRESTENLEQLLAALSGHGRTLSLSGHTHMQRHFYLGSDDGYTPRNNADHHHYNVATASGTWWRGAQDERGIPHTMMRDGAPNGYAVLAIDGNSYSVRYKAAGFPDAYQMNIEAPDEVIGTEAFSVNVFNGSPRSTVEFRVGEDGPWNEMRFTPGPDPRYAAIVAADTTESRGRTLSQPADSHHLWSGNIPSGLPDGTHWLWVRCTDPFGRQDLASHPLRVRNAEAARISNAPAAD